MTRYLVTLDKELGMIVNFRQQFLKPKRILNPEAKNKTIRDIRL